MADQSIDILVRMLGMPEVQQAIKGLQGDVSATATRLRSDSARMKQAFNVLDVRPVRDIRREITTLQAAYNRLARDGRTSLQDLQRAKTALRQRTRELNQELKGTQRAAASVAGELRNWLTLGSITAFVRSAINENRRLQASFKGLEAVANHTGVGIGQAMEVVTRLTADGLMSVADASKALQNLLQRGYDIGQAEQTLTRLQDAAAFNRAAHLSLSEAVMTASEGLKNENSILVDNAGVTKNVSVMWKDYAASIGKTVGELTQQEKIQAEVNGVLKETEAQAGNAAKAAAGMEGAIARMQQAVREFNAAVGKDLAPTVTALAQGGATLIRDFLAPAVRLWQQTAVASALGFDILQDVLRLDFGGMVRHFEAARDTMQDIESSAREGVKPALEEISEQEKQAAAVRKQLEGERDRLRALRLQKDKAAAEESKRVEIDAQKAVVSAQKDAIRETEQALKDSLGKQKRYLETIKDLSADQVAAEQDTAGKVRELRRRDLDEAAQQADIRREAEVNLARATLALYQEGSDPAQIRETASAVQALAGQLTDTSAAVSLTEKAGSVLNRAYEAEKQKAEEAAAAEAQRAEVLRASIEAQKQQLAGLEQTLNQLTAKTNMVKVDADISAAEQKIAQLEARLTGLQGATVTAGAATPQGFQVGGWVPGYGGGDRYPILTEGGEHVTRKERARLFRPVLDLINRGPIAVARKLLPGYRMGGEVVPRARMPALPNLPRFAGGGTVSGGSQLVFHLDGQTFRLSSSGDASALRRAVARQRRKTGGRR